MRLERILWASLCVAFALSAGACATDYEQVPRESSFAVAPEAVKLAAAFAADADGHPDHSGFVLIRGGREAFTSRIELSDRAERTLDAQYYIWDSDATGLLLADRMIRAADRGVRVRLMIDDLNVKGRENAIAAMDAHPNIQVRLFNPFRHRKARAIDFVFDMGEVNHRMHNKVLIADNTAAILGGRNIADVYFQVAADANYRDLDVLSVGPVVQEASAVFDHFWNSHWAVPIRAAVGRAYTESDLEALRQTMRALIAERSYPHPLEDDEAALEQALPGLRERMVWAPGRVIWDAPSDFDAGIRGGAILRGLTERLETLERELLIESAYFVAPEPYVRRIEALIDRGVRVRILTNSLESNDVIAAHAGHAAHRPDLIRTGAELYELKADAETVEKEIFPMRSRAALHTKALAFDGEAVFIGSFNLDPRSAIQNTEIGVYVESRELAQRLGAYMDEGVTPDNAYRVTLAPDGALRWTTVTDGETVMLENEPGISAKRRAIIGLIQFLPVEDQL